MLYVVTHLLSYLTAAVTEALWGVTHLINVGCHGFGWGPALWCGPVCGLSPDGADWPVGLHRAIRHSRST